MEQQQTDEMLKNIAGVARELGEVNKQIDVLETVSNNLKEERKQLVAELNVLNAGYMHDKQEVVTDLIDKCTGVAD